MMTARTRRPHAPLQARHDAHARAADAQALRPDHGTHTPAQAARSNSSIETTAAGVTRRVYDDALLIDRMRRVGQLSDRLHAAALRVAELHAEAGFEPRQAASYAPHGWGRGHDDDTAEHAAVTRFRATLGGCTMDGAWVLHGLCLGQHPGIRRLEAAQMALANLAVLWGIGEE